MESSRLSTLAMCHDITLHLDWLLGVSTLDGMVNSVVQALEVVAIIC